jgi:hypothetical protein
MTIDGTMEKVAKLIQVKILLTTSDLIRHTPKPATRLNQNWLRASKKPQKSLSAGPQLTGF